MKKIVTAILIANMSMAVTQTEIDQVKREAAMALLQLADKNPHVRSKAFRVQLDLAENIENLEDNIKSLVAENPNMKGYWFFNLGQYYLKKSDYSKALSYLEKIEESSEYYDRSILMKAETYFNIAKFQQAKDSYVAALKQSKLNDTLREYANLKLSWTDFNLREYEGAIKRVEYLYKKKGNLNDESLAAWKRFQVFANSDPVLVMERGKRLLGTSQLAKETYLQMALGYDNQGNFKNATRFFELLRNQYPEVVNDKEYLIGAIRSNHRDGNDQKINELAKALYPLMQKEDASFLKSIAQYYYKVAKLHGQKKDIALNLLQPINKVDPTFSSLLMEAQIDNSDKRIDVVNKALAMSSNPEEQKTLIEVFEEPYKDLAEILSKDQHLATIEKIYRAVPTDANTYKQGIVCAQMGLTCQNYLDYSKLIPENQSKILQAFTIEAKKRQDVSQLKAVYGSLKKADVQISKVSLALVEELDTKQLVDKGDFEQAAQKYQEIAKIQGDSSSKKSSLQNSFYYYGKAGRLDLQMSLVEDNNVADSTFIIEVAEKLKKIGDREKAIEWYKKALKIDPSKKEVLERQVAIVSESSDVKLAYINSYPKSSLSTAFYETFNLKVSDSTLRTLASDSTLAKNKIYVNEALAFESKIDSIKEITEQSLVSVEKQWKKIASMNGNKEGAEKVILGLSKMKDKILSSPAASALTEYIKILEERINQLKGVYQ